MKMNFSLISPLLPRFCLPKDSHIIFCSGFAFLKIPSSYYGFLQYGDFKQLLSTEAEFEEMVAKLQAGGICDSSKVVKFECGAEEIQEVCCFLKKNSLILHYNYT